MMRNKKTKEQKKDNEERRIRGGVRDMTEGVTEGKEGQITTKEEKERGNGDQI